jgi:hypothetical protein
VGDGGMRVGAGGARARSIDVMFDRENHQTKV